VLDVRVNSGLFSLDSVCGLSYKTSGSTRGLQSAVFPNPATESASVAFITREPASVVITLRDALGRDVLEVRSDVLEVGTHIIPLDLGGLQAATYFVCIRSGNSNRTLPLVVRPQ